MAMPPYVLIADIVDSKRVADRQGLTERILRTIAEVNAAFAADLLAPFEVTRGDEFAAVLGRAAGAWVMLDRFTAAFAPVALRAVLTRGELTAGLETRRATIIDGPAFQHANTLMLDLKKSGLRLAVDAGAGALDRAAAALGSTLLWRWEAMTDVQREIARAYQHALAQGQRRQGSQARAAERLGKTQQQVHTTLKALRYDLLESEAAALLECLAAIDRMAGPEVLS